MEFEKLLRLMVEKGGSDLFITAGVPPSMKVNGKIMPVTKNAMSPEMTRETVLGVMNEAQRREFATRAFGVSSHYDTAIHAWFEKK